MACADPKHSSYSQIAVRSTLNDLRLRTSASAALESGWILRFLRACLTVAEWLAREQLRHAAREIDPRLIDELAASDPEAACELRKLFDL